MTDYYDYALRSAKVIVLLTLAVVIGAIGWATVNALDSITAAAGEHRELATDSREALSGLMAETDATLQRISVAADQFAEASKEQRKQALVTTQEVTSLVKDLRSVAYRVENETIPAVNDAIKNQDKQLTLVMQESARLIYDTNAQLVPLLAETTKMAEQGTEASIKLNATLDDVQSAMKHVDATAANVEKTSGHIEQKIKQMTKPASWAKAVGLFILDVSYKFASIFK